MTEFICSLNVKLLYVNIVLEQNGVTNNCFIIKCVIGLNFSVNFLLAVIADSLPD